MGLKSLNKMVKIVAPSLDGAAIILVITNNFLLIFSTYQQE